METGKVWYKSKMIWTTMLLAVVSVLQAFGVSITNVDAYIQVALTVILLILRLITKEEVVWESK